MKIKGEFVTILILVLAIIGFSLWISYAKDIYPYHHSNKGLLGQHSNYEGFSPNLDSSSITGSTIDSYLPVNDVQVNLIAKPESSANCVKLNGSWEGNGLNCSSNNSYNVIDLFSQLQGSLDCDETSSGYHNSKGGLCQSNQTLQLLGSRGGNATGGNSQIGTA